MCVFVLHTHIASIKRQVSRYTFISMCVYIYICIHTYQWAAIATHVKGYQYHAPSHQAWLSREQGVRIQQRAGPHEGIMLGLRVWDKGLGSRALW